MSEESLAEILAAAIRAARGDATQEWLGQEVARVEGRKEAYGQNTVAGWESGRYMLKPAKVFAVERALGVPPGSISRLAGYLPPDAVAAKSVAQAIAADPDLTADQREDLTAQYRGMVSRTKARRATRRSRSGR